MTIYLVAYDPDAERCQDGGKLHDWLITGNRERVGECRQCGLEIRGRQEPNRDGDGMTFEWYSDFLEDGDTVVLLHNLGVTW